jgi:hypothetical protein
VQPIVPAKALFRWPILGHLARSLHGASTNADVFSDCPVGSCQKRVRPVAAKRVNGETAR